MGRIILNGLAMRCESRSYVDAMHAIVSHRGWFRQPKPMLSGMTVTGFRFAVDRRLSAQSPTAYNWIAENFLAADFVGLTSAQHAGFAGKPTFPLHRKRAVQAIRHSLDRGVGAVFWHGSFVVAAGYDDDLGALLYSDGAETGLRLLPYEQFGHNGTPYWYYQLLHEPIPMDALAVYRESCLQAIHKWEHHDLILPPDEYACGRLAYEAIAAALAGGDYDREGAAHTFLCYAASKRDIAAYFAEVHHVWPEAGAAAALYRELAALFARIAAPEGGDNGDRWRLALVREAAAVEGQAIEVLRRLCRESADNRRHDIGLR